MPDTKLKYFYDWIIEFPEELPSLDLRKRPKAVREKSFSDIKSLVQNIRDCPEATFMDRDFGYTLAMLRQKAFKGKVAVEEWKKVRNAIFGDGRSRKTEEGLKGLHEIRSIILADIDFFKEVLGRNKDEGIPVKTAIRDFLTRGCITAEQTDNRLKQESNYETTYYAYKRIYETLNPTLSDLEIFCFFEKAALNLNKANALIDVHPDGRHLTFVKVKTWYTWGSDMYWESDQD